jgi:hypothetical protein
LLDLTGFTFRDAWATEIIQFLKMGRVGCLGVWILLICSVKLIQQAPHHFVLALLMPSEATSSIFLFSKSTQNGADVPPVIRCVRLRFGLD